MTDSFGDPPTPSKGLGCLSPRYLFAILIIGLCAIDLSMEFALDGLKKKGRLDRERRGQVVREYAPETTALYDRIASSKGVEELGSAALIGQVFQRLDFDFNDSLDEPEILSAHCEIIKGPLKLVAIHEAYCYLRQAKLEKPLDQESVTLDFQRFVRGVVEGKISDGELCALLSRLTTAESGIFEGQADEETFNPGCGKLYLKEEVKKGKDGALALWLLGEFRDHANAAQIPREPYDINYSLLFSRAIDRGIEKVRAQ